MTCDVGNPGPAIGQAQKYGGVKPVIGIPTVSSIYVCTSVKQKYIRTYNTVRDIPDKSP